jgi:hypothetical protein
MGVIHNFLRTNYRPGEWLGRLCSPQERNRQNNIFQDCKGVWCRIEKPVNQEGRGWRWIVDGTSDIYDGTQPPWVTSNPKAAIRLESSDATTNPIQFSSEYQTNPAILSSADEGVGVYTTIAAATEGIYAVKLTVNAQVDIDVAIGQASVTMKDGGDATRMEWGIDGRDIAKKSGGSTNRILIQSSTSADMLLGGGAELRCIPTTANGYILNVVWTVNLYQPYTVPPT